MSESKLMLHCGAREVDRSALALVPTPAATATWFPVPHAKVIETVEQSLTNAGFEIRKANFGLSRNDARMFGTLDLATPSPRTIITTVCGPNAIGDSVGLLMGHVRRTGTSVPVDSATVTVEWGETIIEKNSVRQRNVAADARTLGPGWFAMCDAPADIELTVSAWAGADSSGYVNVEVPRSGVSHVSFHVGGAHRVPAWRSTRSHPSIRRCASSSRKWCGEAEPD